MDLPTIIGILVGVAGLIAAIVGTIYQRLSVIRQQLPQMMLDFKRSISVPKLGRFVKGDTIPIRLTITNSTHTDVPIQVKEKLPLGVRRVKGAVKWSGMLESQNHRDIDYFIYLERAGTIAFKAPALSTRHRELIPQGVPFIFQVEDSSPANLLVQWSFAPRLPKTREIFEIVIWWINSGSVSINTVTYDASPLAHIPDIVCLTDLNTLQQPFAIDRFGRVEHRFTFQTSGRGIYKTNIANIAFSSGEQPAKLPDQDITFEVEFNWEVPLVGREGEMQEITRELIRTKEGVGGVVFLHGEAGIGKSRLTHEIAKIAEQSGFVVLQEYCEPLSTTTAFYPFRQLLDKVVNAAPTEPQGINGDTLSRSARYASFLMTHYPELKDYIPILNYFLIGELNPDKDPNLAAPRELHQAFLTAMHKLVEAITKQSPLLIILDDLQFADPSSIDVIQHLGMRSRNLRLLIVGLYRDEDVHTNISGGKEHPLIRSMRELLIDNVATSILLKRLGAEQSNLMLQEYFPNSAFPLEFANYLYRETEGIPLYMREALKLLVDRRELVEANGKWRLTRAATDIPIPATVEEVIRARLKILKPEEIAELEKAAVIGLMFNYQHLRELSQIDESTLQVYLEDYIDNNIIIETQEAGNAE